MKNIKHPKKIVAVVLLLLLFLGLPILTNAQESAKTKPLAYFSFDKVENDDTIDPFNNYYGVLMDGSTGALQKNELKESDVLAGPQVDSDGKYGSSLVFDGVQSYIDVFPDMELVNSNTLSTTFWLRVEKLPENKQTIIQLLGDQIGGENSLADISIAPGGLSVNWVNLDGSKEVIKYPDMLIGQWVHVAAIWDSDQVSLYVNGEKKQIKESTLVKPESKYMIIGANTGGDFFNGSLDELRVYDFAISEKQIQDDMNDLSLKEPVLEQSSSQTDTVTNFPFDFLSGNTASDLYGKYTGILKDGLSPTASDLADKKLTEGKSSKALLFDGIDDSLDIAHSELSLSSSTSLTLSAWIKLGSTGSAEFQTIIRQKPDQYGSPWPYSLGLDKTNTHAQFTIATGSLDVDRFIVLNSNSEIPVGEWTLVTAVLGEGKMKLYINGVLDSEQGFTGSIQPSTTRALSIGSSEPFEQNFNGVIDELKIYNYVLSEDDIRSLTNIQYYPGLPETSYTPEPTMCSAENPGICYTESQCTEAGLNWCLNTICQVEACS